MNHLTNVLLLLTCVTHTYGRSAPDGWVKVSSKSSEWKEVMGSSSSSSSNSYDPPPPPPPPQNSYPPSAPVTSSGSCKQQGEFLPVEGDRCFYYECIVMKEPWKNDYGDIPLDMIKRQCAPGTGTPLGYEGGSDNPCTAIAEECSPKQSTSKSYPPVEESYPPVEESYPPVEESYPPVEESYPPMEDSYPPMKDTFGRSSSKSIRQIKMQMKMLETMSDMLKTLENIAY